jgi:CRP-like cAMP-binding protein
VQLLLGTAFDRGHCNGGPVGVALTKGEIAFHQGDAAQHWFEVLTGVMGTCRIMIAGQRQIVGFFYPGDVFGIEAGTYDATAEAITDVTLAKHHHAFLPPEQVERALRHAQECILLLGHRTATERLAAFITMMAERSGRSGRVSLPMSRADIADHLGLTIHTVSRTFTDLVRRGVVAPNGRQSVRIVDAEALARCAGDAEASTNQ